jgi:adenosylmethionine-8-amino-7-oxononanoate aminotransferase
LKRQGCYTWQPLKRANEGDTLNCIVRGDGSYIYDEAGKKYIDYQSGLWNVSLGYNNKNIIDAIVNQLNSISYVNPCEHINDTVVRVSNKIINITPEKFNSVFFTCTGSESVELSIKYARKYQELNRNISKNKIGVLKGSYHGTYYGSMSASQLENEFKDGYGPLLEGFINFPDPFCRCCRVDELKKECLDSFLLNLESKFDKYKDELAAFIFEPILGSAGVIPLPQEYVKLLRNLCDKYKILLICDEVATGFGRTGKMFGFEHYGITPDVICLSKCMNSGYLPIGAVVISDTVRDTFIKNECIMFHLSTQNCNPVCCASTEAVIDILTNEKYLEIIELKGEILKKDLEDKIKEHNLVFDIRGVGLMLAIDLVNSKVTNEPINRQKLRDIVSALKSRGIIVGYFYNCGISCGIDIFPPFITSYEQIDDFSDILSKVLNRFG